MLRGIGVNTTGGVQYHDDDADKALGRLERGGPARMDHLLEISQHWHGSLHQSGEVPRRQGTGGDAAWEDRGRLARDHLERGDHEQQAGYD